MYWCPKILCNLVAKKEINRSLKKKKNLAVGNIFQAKDQRTFNYFCNFHLRIDLGKIIQIRNIERPQENELLSPQAHFYFFGSLHSIIQNGSFTV